MSKESPQPQQSEEVDLGQLFKLIGNAFDRLFRFIGSIFNKLFLAFVWMVFFVKTHFLKFVIAGIVGIVYGIFQEKTSEPVYKSYITVKQNYNTGENLYNSVEYYGDLVKQKDTTTLANVLGVDADVASSILDFEIESVISDNQKIKNYDDYLKTLDSSLASTIDYETYLNSSKDYTHQVQQITIKAKQRNSFKSVFEKIVNNIETNDFFKREKEKDLAELNNEKLTIKEALIKSDSLQSTYKRVLERVLDSDKNNGSEVGITFEGTSDKEKTKEFDLYKSDLELRRELVKIDREIADKKNIIEVISSKQDSGTIDNKKEILGQSISPKLFYAIILSMLTLLVLLGLTFLKYLERFKSNL